MRSTLTIAVAALALALQGCAGEPAKTTTIEEIFAKHPEATANVGSLVVVVLHVRPPVRELDQLPRDTTALLIPPAITLARPQSKDFVNLNNLTALFDPRPKGLVIDPEAPAGYAVLVGEPHAFTYDDEIALGWAGIGPRIWVHPVATQPDCVELVIEGDPLVHVVMVKGEKGDRSERVPAWLAEAWFPGLDTIYMKGKTKRVGDPSREGFIIAIVRPVKPNAPAR